MPMLPSLPRLGLLGSGIALPGSAISTQQLCEKIQAQFGINTARMGQRLNARLGVEQRHICRDFATAQEPPRAGHRNPELAAQALQQALQEARLHVSEIDYLITHTATPVTLVPPNSAQVVKLLGYEGAHVELRQACTGFANALQLAVGLLMRDDIKHVAIVGSETGSVYFDPTQLAHDTGQWVNFLQMGDGAGAVVLGKDEPKSGLTIQAPYFAQLNGTYPPGLTLRAGGSDQAYLSQAGHLLFEHDFESVAENGLALLQAGRDALATKDILIEQCIKIVPHQANGVMSAWLAAQWHMNEAQLYGNGHRVGNLGSASIWVALHHLRQDVILHSGERVAFLGAEATQHTYGGFALVKS
jgi:3-oxoacyl-[acyl-carrier-protein] synthase III